MIESRSELRLTLRADSHRYVASTPSSRYLQLLRLTTYVRHRGPAWRPAAIALGVLLSRAKRRLGIDIHPDTPIGPGLYLSDHPGGIVVNPAARIGANCNLSHGVTIGQANRGQRAGAPTLGDRVWVGPGAKIIGAVNIGDGALIGPNVVIAQDVEPNAVLAAPEATIVSRSGSDGYVNRTLAV